MDQRIADCLNGIQDSYIFPFLWLHGESHERLKEEILAIKNCGIRQLCAESRPYENFCREEWWEDFGFILKTARELDMKVWLLDDKKFPTGFANGYLEAPERAHLRKKLIREKQFDVVGPMRSAKLYIDGWLKPEETVNRVIAYRHANENEQLDSSTAVDLTDRIKDGMAYWDIPEGIWRVCVMLNTKPPYPANSRFHYNIDMLNPVSCRAMIDAIYEPHYEHFKEYFGNTFVGFFSDEPSFLNLLGTYHNTLGMHHKPYPWSPTIPALIAAHAGVEEERVTRLIPALWEDLGEDTAWIREHYMEVVTELYRTNFSNLLGDWCREHGVLYIGHVIEDSGCHMRLGYGAGHFFRALDGQDMAGIDIVLIQDTPGISDHIHRAPISDEGVTDPAFFRYTLPKLAASHAHIQPRKQNRAMCELFGAFGWAEGLPYMKGLADIMIASGINRFVPHAFSAKEEDPDCPPHFYNGGKNIQYPLFGKLMSYMERATHVLEGGTHQADVAVFYNAEGEWTGGENEVFHNICKHLSQNLIDFDIIPHDYLEGAEVKDGKLTVNGERFGALIVSRSEILPKSLLDCFLRLAKSGLPVIFTDALPERIAEGGDIASYTAHFTSVPLAKLASSLKEQKLNHVSGAGNGLSHLRFYHVKRQNEDVYLFSNEGIRDTVDGVLTLPQSGECLIYDPWDNQCYRGCAKDGKLPLQIENGNMLFICFGTEIPAGTPIFSVETARHPLSACYDISIRDEEETEFSILAQNSELFDISDRDPRFSGEVRYEAKIDLDPDYTVLDLGEVGEVAEAWLNGQYLGARIAAPYKFSLRDAKKDGENHLTVLVKSNLAHRRRDDFSKYLQIPPTGIIGDVALCKYEKLYDL
ncbi:MAG: hypothetical protein IJW16_06970 [Clostridia bacterium]|nr:hypothetical protein [Clostridia bacterium]